jgi:hypothetical protein
VLIEAYKFATKNLSLVGVGFVGFAVYFLFDGCGINLAAASRTLPCSSVANQINSLLGNHHHWGIGVTRNQGGHDGAVDHAQAFDAVDA